MPILIESFSGITQFVHPQYLIKPLLELGSTAMLFGASGSGKTFDALDMACSVATGLSWAGMRTRESPVVYITAEGNNAFGRRVSAWHKRALSVRLTDDREGHERFTELLETNLHVIRAAVQVGRLETRMDLIDAIRTKVSADQPLGLIVVDTLARCSIDFDENSNGDMTRFVDAMVDLKTRLRATGRMDGDTWNQDAEDESLEPVILILHHTGHAPAGDPTWRVRERGASALRGALDVVIAVEQDSLIVRKMKDGEEPLPMAVTWDDTFVVGEDEDGMPVRGRVAVVREPGSAHSPEEKKKIAKGAEMADSERDIMRLMEERPDATLQEIADDLDLSRATVGRRVAALKKSGAVTKAKNEWVVDMPQKSVSRAQSPFLH